MHPSRIVVDSVGCCRRHRRASIMEAVGLLKPGPRRPRRSKVLRHQNWYYGNVLGDRVPEITRDGGEVCSYADVLSMTAADLY